MTARRSDQMTNQALDVESAQRLPPPVGVAEAAKRALERVGRPAERLGGRNLFGLARGPARGSCLPRGREYPTAQVVWQRRRPGAHDDSSNCRSSTEPSLASASLSRDLAVPSGIPTSLATWRKVRPWK